MMRFNSRESNNLSVLKKIMSKSRRLSLPDEIDYIILYTFFYKYCSDNLKDHFLLVLNDKELTLDEAYESKIYPDLFMEDSLNLYGFYIDRPSAFMDEVIHNSFSSEDFLSEFFTRFPQSIIFFDEYHDGKYFDYFFETVKNIVLSNHYDTESETYSAIKEIIYLISQLDVLETGFSFVNAFDIIASSRLMHIDSNPEYILQILSNLVLSQKESVTSVYDPFMKNAGSIMELSNSHGFYHPKVYGKEISTLNYCFAIVRLFINNFLFNDVFLEQEDAVQSVDMNGISFDVILSNIPIAIKNYHSSNRTQTLEMAKRNKRSELEKVLIKNFDIDGNSFTQDVALNNALENLVERMDFEEYSNMDFVGEYEILQDSEFLFLINLIEALKDDGIMAVSISQNFLFKNSLETLRKYLTLKCNYIDAVISIPHEIDRYKRPEVVIVFRKNRQNSDILFIDMSKDYETKKAALIFPGLFKRNLILDNKTINKMRDVFANRLTISKYSKLISIDEIAENDFILSVSRYVDTFEGEFVELSELTKEKEDIDSNIKELNLKIEKMMNELNIRF